MSKFEEYKNYMCHLTEEQKDHEHKLNSKNGYGMSKRMLLQLTAKHKKAREEEDYITMEKIEYRLTAINFHLECEMMHNGQYKDIREYLKSKV